MDKSDVAYLISITYTTDSIGQRIASEVSKMVYCRMRSVSQSEWFAAAQNNMKPQYEMTMLKQDYSGQTVVKYDNVKYSVYRTYVGTNDTISLYLEEKAGV